MPRELTEYEKDLIEEYNFHPEVKKVIMKAWSENSEIKKPGTGPTIVSFVTMRLLPIFALIILGVSIFRPDWQLAKYENLALIGIWIIIALIYFAGIFFPFALIIMSNKAKDFYCRNALTLVAKKKNNPIATFIQRFVLISILAMLAWLHHNITAIALLFVIAAAFGIITKARNKILAINHKIEKEAIFNGR